MWSKDISTSKYIFWYIKEHQTNQRVFLLFPTFPIPNIKLFPRLCKKK